MRDYLKYTLLVMAMAISTFLVSDVYAAADANGSKAAFNEETGHGNDYTRGLVTPGDLPSPYPPYHHPED